MARLFRHLLLVAVLLLSLAGHAAMAGGPQLRPAVAGPHLHAMHDDGSLRCSGGQHCPAPGQGDRCCLAGHCLLAVMADGAIDLPAFRPALPVPPMTGALLAAPQAAPERPPRLA